MVGGVGVGDASYMSRFREVAANTESNLDFQYLTGLPPDELVDELNNAPANSGVIMTIYDLDNTGQLQQTMSVTRLMVDNTDLPVFAMNDTQPSAGAVGGNVTTTAAYARSTFGSDSAYFGRQYPNPTGHRWHGISVQRPATGSVQCQPQSFAG